MIALKHLFGRSLEAVAGQCQNPQAVRNVAQALQGEDSFLHLQPEHPSTPTASWGTARASFDIHAFRSRLAGMEPGQHWLMRATESTPQGAHAMGVAIQKQPDGRFRLSVINSNGWKNLPDHPASVVPAVFKTVSMEEAVAAMGTLLSGPLSPPPDPVSESQWTTVGCGTSLATWLIGSGNPGLPAAEFHDSGTMLWSTRQKTYDCGIECQFAFMASALKPADYKLAKAACLNTLVQIADQLESPYHAPAHSPVQHARQRLQERITTSLSGSMVASTPASKEPGR